MNARLLRMPLLHGDHPRLPLEGGFLLADDFRGTEVLIHFARELERVFPEYPIVDNPLDHPLFGIA
jgi:hypothetical protein